MNLKSYFESIQKTYKFRINSVVEFTEEDVSRIEHLLEKHRPSKISAADRMMFQTNPLGYTGVKNTEIHFIDVELTLPVSRSVLEYDLRAAFGFDSANPVLFVEGECDNPLSEVDEHFEEVLGEEGALLCDNDYSEAPKVVAEDYFGDDYNEKFLARVAEFEAKRTHKQEIDPLNPITKWSEQPECELEVEQDDADFNAGIAGEKAKFETMDIGQSAGQIGVK